MSDNTDDFRDWRFDGASREHLLERRVRELEETVARLEKQLHANRRETDFDYAAWQTEKRLGASIGATAGTLGGILPQSPYKAD